ncbi:hypothetical protein PQO03_18280 [Lentisphaera profundi]|uniref:Uncharacterized protein n=1 Tax=Lentisphaera profundi TaxID=1658616 RepID=A0ABY7VVN7_9BACT|nr:LamG-like jellyroll fold domain-containing protein [Lentisphaera profundi]WDE97777.1 hypothetical protein PQO03_18280 [Lentisphaera profundi]
MKISPLLSLVTLACLNQITFASETSEIHTITNKDMTDISYYTDEYLVHSNLWGARAMKENAPPFQFNLHKANGPLPCNVAYDWTIFDKFETPIFPYMGYGDRLWATKPNSTTNKLPIQIKDIAVCDIYCDLEIDEKNFDRSKGNLAYDVWFARDKINNDDEKRIEIMLWFNRNEQYPVGGNNHQGVYSFFGIQWDLYVGNLKPKTEGGQGTTVCTFIAQTPAYKGMINFMKPIEIIKRKGLLLDTDYLGAFELGNEVYLGNGSTHIKGFHVDVQPVGLPQDKLRLDWRFHHLPFSKQYFDGSHGITTSLKNQTAVEQASIAIRFRPLETEKRQILYKEGKTQNGLSIYLEKGQINFASWNTIDGKIVSSFSSTPLVKAIVNQNSKTSATYVNAVVSLDQATATMTTYLDGEILGTQTFYGLEAKRGNTTFAFADGNAKLPYPDGVKQDAAFFNGIIDDILIYDAILTPEQVALIK